MRDNIGEIKLSYDFKLSLKKDCVELNVVAGKFLTNVGDLKVDTKYKIFLKTDVQVSIVSFRYLIIGTLMGLFYTTHAY